MTPRPHGAYLPGQLGALLVAGLVMTAWAAAAWAIWAWPLYPLRRMFGL